MPPDTGQSATPGPGAAGWDPLGIAATQAQAFKSLQSWSDSLLQTFREQVSGQQALLSQVRSSLEAMQLALASQDATNRALRESLDSYQQIVSQAMGAQEAQVRLIQGALDALADTVKGQLETAQALSAPSAASFRAVQDLTEQWLSAWRTVLAPPGSPQAPR
jgi:hypothetical protein